MIVGVAKYLTLYVVQSLAGGHFANVRLGAFERKVKMYHYLCGWC